MFIPTVPVGTLNCPPVYAYHLLLTQRRILFASLLQNPVTMLIIERHRGFTNPTMIELCHLFQIYCTICLTHTCLCPTDIPPVYAAAMQTAIAEVCACILDLLHKEGFAKIVNDLPRMAVSPILTPLLQGMSEVDHHLYFNNVIVPNPPLWSSTPSPAIPVPLPPSDKKDTPSTIINPGTPPIRAISVDSTSSLSSYQSVPAQLPPPQVATPFNPCHLHRSRQTIFQGGLISRNARSLNAQGARMVRVIITDVEAMAAAANAAGTRKDPIDVDVPMHNNPTPHPPTPGPIYDPNLPCFQCQSRDYIKRIVPTTAVLTATGWPLAITNQFVQNKNVDSVERRDILSPTVHLMTTGMITISLRMRDMLGTELVTQGNKGGNVMVFFSFLPSPYGLIISPSTYGYHVTWLPM